MKTLSTLLALVVGFAVFTQITAAQETKRESGARVRERIAESMADLNLTDQQEAKIAQIRKECSPKIQEAAKELTAVVKEEVEKVRAISLPAQKERRSALSEERKESRHEGVAERIAHLDELDLTEAELAQIGEIREQYRSQVEKLMTELAGILTDSQKEARTKALKSGESRREVRDSLNLTPQQKQKADAISKDLAGVVRQKLEKMQSVLTPEQQEKVAAFRAESKAERRDRVRDRMAFAIENASDLSLTNEQKASIAKIRNEYRPKVQTAGDKLRAAVREELSQIAAVVKS